MNMNSKWQKITATLLAAAIGIALVPKITDSNAVLAAGVKNKDNTCLGTSGIASPVAPETNATPWTGSYVYFGTYNGEPIKFRVLDPYSKRFGRATLFLDCDKILFDRRFDEDSNVWIDSELRACLNGEFLSGSFSLTEQTAIAPSYLASGTYESGSWADYAYEKTVALTGEKIFLLDDEDMINESYGYSSDSGWFLNYGSWSGQGKGRHEVPNHIKTADYTERIGWWLRTALKRHSGAACEIDHVGVLSQCLVFNSEHPDAFQGGVSPALNIDQSSLLFSTVINDGDFNETRTEYKLTLMDSDIKIALQSGKQVAVSGSKLTIPYSVSGSNAGNATRVSVLILDKEYKAGNTNDAKIIYYDALGGSYGKTGTGSVTLPSSLKISDWGTKYYIYIIAEDINSGVATDYASEPLLISAPTNTPTPKPTATPVPTKKPTATPTPAGKKSTWSQESGKWYYYDKNGSKVTGWYQVGSWYLFDKNGVMLTGWQQDGGKWYYLGNGGAMRTGWVQINGLWYYLDASGAMKTGWLKLGKVWYYLKADGSMAANEYCEGYWLNADGSWTYTAKASWYKNTSGWYYQDTAGWYAKNGTYKIDGKNYNFGKTGYCLNP